ncbi:hypothetical protein [Sphingobacterium hungaricum]|uniref:Uncharacterized protein n=1 Tax=Sphingobacterium hungaricum TaxID=2082723 RepID=A0A928UT26_9SPHI|nr:hypothetical protein [Sphingobacterium hungaricum]MBE8712816.1 hypothetical protein [Sphingobacterium hungaricum]
MSKTEKKQIKNSILMIAGMLCLLIGLNTVTELVKYPALIVSLASFLYMIFGFVMDATHQLSSAKKENSK